MKIAKAVLRGVDLMAHHIVRRIRFTHCKQGPDICEDCRRTNNERICLLDIDPKDADLMQRRLIEVEIEGEKVWREYDVVRSFNTDDEARQYAEQESISDIDLT